MPKRLSMPTCKSGVKDDKYRDQMREGSWKRWNTPRLYKNLDGTGRKLLLYDNRSKEITVEVEIWKVRKTNFERDYPWTNYFAKNPTVYTKPIPLEHIRLLLALTGGKPPFQHTLFPGSSSTKRRHCRANGNGARSASRKWT